MMMDEDLALQGGEDMCTSANEHFNTCAKNDVMSAPDTEEEPQNGDVACHNAVAAERWAMPSGD
jgi:hypothetical protein